MQPIAFLQRNGAAIPPCPRSRLRRSREQLTLAVDRVMNEGSLYDRELAALAIKQAARRSHRGDLPHPRHTHDTAALRLRSSARDPAMRVKRRVSAAFKDIPGGQILGPTFDYTHRLLDFALVGDSEPEAARDGSRRSAVAGEMPRVLEILGARGPDRETLGRRVTSPAISRSEPLNFPAGRDLRLQGLARGDEGFLLALAYSTQRGYGRTHPFAGEIRHGRGRGVLRARRSWASPIDDRRRSPSPNAR